MSDDDAALIARIEADPGLNTYERAVIVLLRRLHERAEQTDQRLANHIEAEDGIAQAWRDAKGAARFLSYVVAFLSLCAGAWSWVSKHLDVSIK